MKIVLWDTRRSDVAKDFAGGFGVGQYSGMGGIYGRIVRRFYKRDRRPTALVFAYLAAIFRRLGHEVQYVEDDLPRGADVYLFHPALVTLPIERAAMGQALRENPGTRVIVVGLTAHTLPEAFAGLEVTLVRGEAEQLLTRFDDVLQHGPGSIDIGSVANLDDLPYPDWSGMAAKRFRISYDFSAFPTGMIQQSRGCTFKCNYCPYIIVENATRFRDPERVVDEMQTGMHRFGFRSFKFRDPLFGLDRQRVLRLVELIGKLPKKIQFSIETRIDLMRPETLRALTSVGLTAITVGIETPAEDTLRNYKRAPIRDDRQREFVDLCRRLRVRTVAGFMIGFPEDTEESINSVLNYARQLNPTFANFNIVTPYPGTEFFQQVKHQVASFDYSQYSVYTPVMKYEHLTAEQVSHLHAECFRKFYFRGRWLEANAKLVWPWLPSFGLLAAPKDSNAPETAGSEKTADSRHMHAGPPRPMSGLTILQPTEHGCSPSKETAAKRNPTTKAG